MVSLSHLNCIFFSIPKNQGENLSTTKVQRKVFLGISCNSLEFFVFVGIPLLYTP